VWRVLHGVAVIKSALKDALSVLFNPMENVGF
jgi:hypothetical protein